MKRPDLDPLQIDLIERVAAEWRSSAEWPRLTKLRLAYRKDGHDLNALLARMPDDLHFVEGTGEDRRLHLTLQGLACTADGARETQPLLALVRLGVQRVVAEPYAQITVNQDDLARELGPDHASDLIRLGTYYWRVRPGGTMAGDGASWTLGFSLHDLIFEGVSDIWDYLERHSDRFIFTHSALTDAHRSIVRLIYDHVVATGAWPDAVPFIVDHRGLGPIWRMLNQLQSEALWALYVDGRNPRPIRLSLGGLRVAGAMRELGWFVAALRVFVQAYEAAEGEVTLDAAEILRCIEAPHYMGVLLEVLVMEQPLGVSTVGEGPAWAARITEGILDWDGINTFEDYASRLAERKRAKRRAGLSGMLPSLVDLWAAALAAESSHEKGQTLEVFGEALFGAVFTVPHRNARTTTEELDLVLEWNDETDERFRLNKYLLVECKNWRAAKVDQREISAFETKLRNKHLKQGFVLTTGNFTKEAREQAHFSAAASQIDIVLIDGEDVAAFLKEERNTNEFLSELHRVQRLRMA